MNIRCTNPLRPAPDSSTASNHNKGQGLGNNEDRAEFSIELKITKPKSHKFFSLNEGGLLFQVGDKTLALYRQEVIDMLLKKYDELPEDRKIDSIKSAEYKYAIYGDPVLEAI